MVKNYSNSSTTIAFWIRRLSLSLLMIGALSSPTSATVKTVEIASSPAVKENQVTIRVKVADSEARPVMELAPENFKLSVDDTPFEFRNRDWKSPQAALPPPAWIVVLLDMSGSMRNDDQRGTRKLEGAVKAIREFRETLITRTTGVPAENIPQVAIVPFGQGSSTCKKDFPVTEEALNKFFPVNDFKLQNHLNFLETQLKDLCASTNLYEPLTRTIRFLGNPADQRFHPPENSGRPQPRLTIILLSDGYHSEPNEESDFKPLVELLKSSQIIVHTLGYGLTPEELGRAYNLNRPATRDDLVLCSVDSATSKVDRTKVQKGKVCSEEFVDQERLKKIADETNGIDAFSGNAQEIADRLQLFLNAILGEYEISYTQPEAERGSKHNVKVEVTAAGTTTASAPKFYTIQVFGRSLPAQTRLNIFLLTLTAMAVFGFGPFWLWASSLKKQT